MATSHRFRLWLGAIALAALIAAIFSGIRDHQFLHFDDTDYVSENPVVLHGLTWAGVKWAFAAPHAGNWHPLTWLSHMADVEIFGVNAGAHLAVNAALHFGTSLLIFLVLQRVTRRAGTSFLVAALFAAHPLHVESVAWVAERKDVLCGFLSLLTIGAHVRYTEAPSRGRYAMVIVCFALALMAKPMAVTLPIGLLLLDVWPLRRIGRSQAVGRHFGPGALLREKVPLLAMAVAACAMTYVAQSAGGAVQSSDAFPLALRLANMPVAYVTYLSKMFWPAGLAVLYPYPDSIPLWQSLGASLVLSAVTLAVIRARRRTPYLAFGWFWFLITLLPVIGLVQVGSQPFADRYMYLPMLGLLVMVVWGIADIARQSQLARRTAAAAGLVAVAASSVAASRQVDVWKDSVTLWEHAIAVTHDNYRAQTNLGFALMESGQDERAMAEYREAIRIEPRYANAHNYLGALLSERGDHTQAAAELRAALAVRPGFVEAHNNLGLALAALGQVGDAIGAFREAVRLNPAFGPAWNNLGIALANAGQIDQAIEAFRKSVELQPNSTEARANLETALKEKDKGKF